MKSIKRGKKSVKKVKKSIKTKAKEKKQKKKKKESKELVKFSSAREQLMHLLNKDNLEENDIALMHSLTQDKATQFQLMFMLFYKEKLNKNMDHTDNRNDIIKLIMDKTTDMKTSELFEALKLISEITHRDSEQVLKLMMGKDAKTAVNLFLSTKERPKEGEIMPPIGGSGDSTRRTRILDIVHELMK